MKQWRRSWTGAAGVLAGIAIGLLPSLGMGDTNGQILSASRSVHDAQTQVNQARQRMSQARSRVGAVVQAKPQYAAAITEFHSAQAAFAAVRNQAMADLQKNTEYRAINGHRQKAQDLLAQADDPDSHLTDAQIRKATGVVMDDGLKLRKMQDDAFAREPGYDDAKNRLESAQLRMDQLDAEVTQEAQNDPDYQGAATELAQANQRLSQARTQLAQAVQADAQRREQEAKAREQAQMQGGFGQ